MHRSLIDILRNRLKWAYVTARYLPHDMLDSLTGKRDEFTPPTRLMFVGGGDFRKIGDEFFRHFVDLCGLKPHHRVLDVGCGIGRMAIPMTTYLDKGSYDGFDIVPAGIKWSTRKITSRYPNFRFQLADIYNKVYNPAGHFAAAEYRFPYEDRSFDLVFLTSVATHILPRDLEHYLAEIARVLKPGGKSLITYFLLNDEARRLMAERKSLYDFTEQGEGYWTISREKPEQAVAYKEPYVRNLYKTHCMRIVEPIRYGSWSGRMDPFSGQDIVLAQKD